MHLSGARPRWSASPARRRRVGRGLVACAALALVLLSWLTVRWFLAPAQHVPHRADAVVVLAGGDGERLERGLELMRAGVAPILVISNGTRRDWTAANELCSSRLVRFTVLCPVPRPYSTAGEAATIGRLAEDGQWRSLALVTSDYHLHRARLLFRRCTGATVHGVAADSDSSVAGFVERIAHEWLGTAYAGTLDRSC